MRLSGRLKHRALNLLKYAGYLTGLLPHRYQLYSAIKIYELDTLLAYLNVSRDATIVDVCCGTGLQTQLLASYAKRTIGIDIDEAKIRDANWHLRFSKVREKVSFLVGRAERLPLADCFADAVVCLCAIEHIRRPEDAVGEIARVLKPGGKLYITADSLASVTSGTLKVKHRQMYDVHRYFEISTLSCLLREAGFVVDTVFPILCSTDAVKELERCMRVSDRPNCLTLHRQLKSFSRKDLLERDHSGGLFIFAVAKKPIASEA